MIKSFINNIIPFVLLIVIILVIGSGCNPSNNPNSCTYGIQYELDGNVIMYDNTQITAEIFNDAAIGKFYDIWTDESSGFYYHSTITENGETAAFDANWFSLNDVGNITFLNSKSNVNIQFEIIQGVANVGEQVQIEFSGTYEDNGTTHSITNGLICTEIDIIH